MKEELKTEPFIPFPRYITKDLRESLITYKEFELYCWIRLHANMFGVSSVNVRGLLDDLPQFKSVDHLTKLLRSLRSKKYIYYKDRQGHRGSFDVYFGDWLLKGGKVRTLDELFKAKEVGSNDLGASDSKSDVKPDVTPNFDSLTPKLNGQGFQKLDSILAAYPGSEFNFDRSLKNNNDIKRDKEINNIDKSSAFKKNSMNAENANATNKKTLTYEFNPRNDTERRCKEIAAAIGDPYINFALSVLHNKESGGLETLEAAYSEFIKTKKYYEGKNKLIKKPAALFNSIVGTIMENQKYKPNSLQSKYAGL